ncbi:MAG: hypothetical protein WD491_02600 [Balneolales bacterium]
MMDYKKKYPISNAGSGMVKGPNLQRKAPGDKKVQGQDLRSLPGSKGGGATRSNNE